MPGRMGEGTLLGKATGQRSATVTPRRFAARCCQSAPAGQCRTGWRGSLVLHSARHGSPAPITGTGGRVRGNAPRTRCACARLAPWCGRPRRSGAAPVSAGAGPCSVTKLLMRSRPRRSQRLQATPRVATRPAMSARVRKPAGMQERPSRPFPLSRRSRAGEGSCLPRGRRSLIRVFGMAVGAPLRYA
jgi:hypothetical protein